MLPFLSKHEITHKKVLLRVDFNVSLNADESIADDTRIQQALPTIKLLLKNQNKIIIVSHLGEPKKRDSLYSLKRVAKDLGKYLPSYHIHLVDDFMKDTKIFVEQKQHEILLLENIRFYPGEKANDPIFAKELASLADVYVNDAFGVSHRKDASIVSIPQFLPHYAGLLIEKEITMLDKVIHHPEKPVVAILGGSKVSTKIELITKLLQLADSVLIGGGMANTFLAAQQFSLGKSFYEPQAVSFAKQLLTMTYAKKTKVVLPQDCVVQGKTIHETSVKDVKADESIMDIGSETQAIFGQHIATAKTIIWNGPVGKFEDPAFSRGTEFIYYAITQNPNVLSVVGGGDTLAAMKNKDYRENITHISTGGGAMLEYIEKGTLPGIEALIRDKR